jgi:X-X-X-Leu-X-X-Gly heptad repeat protein
VKQAFASVAPTLENVTVNIDTMAGGLDQMSKQIGSSLSGTDITAQITQLSGGLTELAKNYSQFDRGLKEYMNGVSTLSTGYQQFDTGLTSFVNGVSDVHSGVAELYDGTNTMNKEISKLPDQMQKEIDTLMEDYDGTDYETISFVSSKNTKTDLVQFVMQCDEIKLPKEDNNTSQPSEDKNETVMDRFLALFKKETE